GRARPCDIAHRPRGRRIVGRRTAESGRGDCHCGRQAGLGKIPLSRRSAGERSVKGVVTGEDGKARCPWPGTDPIYVAYHDTEWGVPEYDDRALFEKLILDGFQAGLSWITILRKRENFRNAFDDFQPEKIARYNAKKTAA